MHLPMYTLVGVLLTSLFTVYFTVKFISSEVTNSKCTFTDFEKYIRLPPTKIKNIATSVLFVTILSHLYIMNTVILEFSDTEHLRIQDKD